MWQAARLSHGPEIICSSVCSFVQALWLSSVEWRKSSLKTRILLWHGNTLFISLFVPLAQNSVFFFFFFFLCDRQSLWLSHGEVGADFRFVGGFPMGNCTRHGEFVHSPQPTFPGVVEKPQACWLAPWPFAWLGLSLPIYKMEFLFPDYLFASNFAVFCSDARWWHVGGVPYYQLALHHSFDPLNPLILTLAITTGRTCGWLTVSLILDRWLSA